MISFLVTVLSPSREMRDFLLSRSGLERQPGSRRSGGHLSGEGQVGLAVLVIMLFSYKSNSRTSRPWSVSDYFFATIGHFGLVCNLHNKS